MQMIIMLPGRGLKDILRKVLNKERAILEEKKPIKKNNFL